MRPWTQSPVVQLITLPGPPIVCIWCARPVRVAVWTPQARYCICGGALEPVTPQRPAQGA